MSFVVVSEHLETLEDGRMVEPGDAVSNDVAQRNQELIDRGVLVKQEISDTPQPAAASEPEEEQSEQKAGRKPAAAPQKGESK